jgi:ribonuclease P protein component
VLPRAHRVVSGEDLRVTQRKGRRSANPLFVMNHFATGPDNPSRWGFIVSKKVGNAVVRNLVKRRMRALAAQTLVLHPVGYDAVVRALPASATATSSDLSAAWSGTTEGWG